MEKKLTKAQLKEIEEKEYELRTLRNHTIEAIREYEEDIRATKRYYQINGMTEELNYDGSLKKTETILKIMRSYKELDFLKPYKMYTEEDRKNGDDKAWDFVRLMIQSKDEYHSYGDDKRLEEPLKQDDLWADDIIWSTLEAKILVKFARQYGYKRIWYTNGSTAALQNITDFIDIGCKVVGTCKKVGYDRAGVIFDISTINYD